MGTLHSPKAVMRESYAQQLAELTQKAQEAKEQGLCLDTILAEMLTARNRLNAVIGTSDTTTFEDQVFADSSPFLNPKKQELTPGMIRRGKPNTDSKKNAYNNSVQADRVVPRY